MRYRSLPVLLALVHAVPAQDPEPIATPAALTENDAEAQARLRTLGKTRQMLEQRPAHPALFDRYFTLLVESNTVEAEIERLQTVVREDPNDHSAPMILGRPLRNKPAK